MSNDPIINVKECDVYLASPKEYDECVVLVESKAGHLFTLTDESRNGKCVAEFPAGGNGRVDWRMTLSDLREILDKAERLLVDGNISSQQ